MLAREVRLLLVDDDPSAVQAMGLMLAQYPDQRFATSGAVALRIAREAPPDLIVLDLDMPVMTGLDLCEALKADPTLAHVPIILATSHDATALLKVVAWQKGVADFVTKPLVAAHLTARVAAQLHTARLLGNLRSHDSSAEPAPKPAAATPRLLIVDDDTTSIHILRQTLDGMGDLHFAKSGEEALRLARHLCPDLVLLDAHMPGLDGFDVCRSLKAEAAFRHVPIVFVTRYSDPRYEARALDLGAADFIPKPYTAAVLLARVRNLLDLKRRADAELQEVREAQSRLRVEAVAATRTKKLLMISMAQEMANPLRALMTSARSMDAEPGHALAPRQALCLELILASGRHLEGLLRDVLDTGSIQAGVLTIEWCQNNAARRAQDAAAVAVLAERLGVILALPLDAPPLQAAVEAD